MDRLDALRAFVAVSEHTSFSAAARAMHVSSTAVSRAVSDLEARLNVMLLRRTTRSVALTPEGASYLERARRALEELDVAARDLHHQSAAPSGELAVTAPVVFGRMHMLPILAGMLRAHPALRVNLTLTDRVVRIAEEGIDVAARIGDLPDSALNAVRLTTVTRILIASPAYLKARGAPKMLEELERYDLIAFDNFTRNGEWRFARRRRSVRVKPRLLTNDVPSAIAAAVAGLGITRLADYQVLDEIRSGALVTLLTAFDPPAVPASLVFQANRAQSPNVRALVVAARAHFDAKIASGESRS